VINAAPTGWADSCVVFALKATAWGWQMRLLQHVGAAGIAWAIVGKHDRPWFDRPVLGQVRYMSLACTGRKFDAMRYIVDVERMERSHAQQMDEPDTERREIEIPPQLRKALGAKLIQKLDALSFTHKKEFIVWYSGAKKEDTRACRVEKMKQMLSSGKVIS